LIQLFEKLDSKAGEKQLEFLNGPSFKKLNETIVEITAKIPEDEAAGDLIVMLFLSCITYRRF
jgi:hypothetical protein